MSDATNKRKRKQEEDARENDSARRNRSKSNALANAIADELICPISLELPLDPVHAEDGRVYEREAIEAHIAQRRGREIRSPATNEVMGPRLFPAVHIGNSIRTLVESGDVDEEKANRWKERIKNEERVAEMKGKAESGDVRSMFMLGCVYEEGQLDVKQDYAKAYDWYKKAADKQYPPGMTVVGFCLVCGVGVEKNKTNGVALTVEAALSDGGCDLAMYHLGRWYADGCHGLQRDINRAKRYLGKAVDLSCKYRHMNGDSMEDAKQLLEELESGNA